MEREAVKRNNVKCGKSEIRILAGCVILLFAVLFMLPVRAGAAVYGSIGNGTKLYAWPLSRADMTVYSDRELTEELEKVSYCQYEILNITDSLAKVRYQGEKGKKTGYVSVDKFIYNPSYKRTGAFVTKNAGMYLYKSPSSSRSKRFVFAPYRSGGITLGVKGNYVQMMIKKKNHFYLGWVSFDTFRKTIYRSMLHSDQILADGTYTLTARVRKSDSVKAKKYKLKYQGEGLYTLQSIQDKSYLEAAEDKRLLLVREGAYFYLRSADGTRGVNYRGEEAAANSTKKQQWTVKKVYSVPTKKSSVVYSQYDPDFGSMVYQNGYDGVRTVATSGCGLISLVNAVYALNGEYLPTKELVNFSVSRGHYFYNSGTADTLYPDIAKKWGKTYHFRHAGKTTSFVTLRNHLVKKGTAVALVPGHYIAIVAYRKSDGKYLVLDSAVSGSRPTSIYGDWKTQGQLSGGRLWCEYFHLFSAR